MKWFIILFAIAIGFAIYSGYMGGARDAAQNYVNVRTGISK